MKNSYHVLVIMLATLLVTGCVCSGHKGCWSPKIKGSGIPKTEQRTVDEYSAIKCMIGADITVTQAEQPALSITADDNLLPIIKTEARNGTLEVSSEESYSSRTRVQIQIKVPMISRVEILGSANVILDSVTDEKLELEILGSGDIEATGKVRALDARISGSGELQLKQLEAATCSIRISGSGDAEVTAKEALDVRVSGSGEVVYYGNPVNVNSAINGSGEIAKGN